MGASVSTVGAVVLAGTAVRTARTLDSLARQRPSLDAVTVSVPVDLDPRVADWLKALSKARGWTLAASGETSPGARANAGLARTPTDHVLVLDAGETLLPNVVAALHEMADHAGAAAVLVGRVRLVALGIDETIDLESDACLEAVDPANPVLRGICWRRADVVASGGFDAELQAAVRYDLWLRFLGRGYAVARTSRTLVQISVEDGEPLPSELASREHGAAVSALLARHAALVGRHAARVLQERALRVTTLGPRHQHALARNTRASARGQESTGLDTESARTQVGFRASPLSRDWGYERGGPLDRTYIEGFLERHASDIRGTVLEVQEADYTCRFGGDAVTRSDVVDLAESNPGATVIADLRFAANIPDGTYDCVILTQTLHVIAQMGEVVAECHRILRTGGVLLVTMPVVSRICLEYGRDGDFWRVTPAGARQLFEGVFGDDVSVTPFGNVLTSTAFQYGLGRHEVTAGELAHTDPYNPTLVGVRAVKAGGLGNWPAIRAAGYDQGVVLLYHRVGGSGPDPHRIAIGREAFDQQMAWLARECAVLPVVELVRRASRGALPRRAVAVTFDDGYFDTLAHAAPTLATHRIPSACMVATEDLDGPHVFWWDWLAELLLGEGARPDRLVVTLTEGTREFSTRTAGERLLAHGLIYHSLVAESRESREQVLETLRQWAPAAAVPADCRRMTADELRVIARAGIAVGAHTVHHPHLTRLSPEAQLREIAESRATLERVVGAPVSLFAYPFGAFDEVSVDAARQAGVSCAFTCEARPVMSGDTPLRLPRIDLRETRLDRFTSHLLHRLESSVA